MARLTYQRRKRLPRSEFAIPERAPRAGSYPIPDRAHARNALARVSAYGTPQEKRRVRKAVARRFPEVLGRETIRALARARARRRSQ